MCHDNTCPQSPAPLAQYINQAEVGHNGFEFILSFGQVLDDETGRIHTRFATTPYIAKLVWLTLGQSIATYEETFGVIAVDTEAS